MMVTGFSLFLSLAFNVGRKQNGFLHDFETLVDEGVLVQIYRYTGEGD
jgi:hypothetical protein